MSLQKQSKLSFDSNCHQCGRLVEYLAETKFSYPQYHCRPVASFGESKARLLIVGLAPGKHGANATGRPFTGDYAGLLLYKTLYRFGFSNRPVSEHAHDGLQLKGCRITNAVKCLPPENKPTSQEIRLCNTYLTEELKTLPRYSVVLALGTIAHRAVLRAKGLVLSHYKFGHGRIHSLKDLYLLDSYHCSRYNTQTGRLTHAGFEEIFIKIKDLLNQDVER